MSPLDVSTSQNKEHVSKIMVQDLRNNNVDDDNNNKVDDYKSCSVTLF